MTLLLIFLFFALSVSFLCSIAESVLLAVPLSYLKARTEKGARTARILWEFKAQINRPLSAILTLNTIANTIGAAGVGAQAVHLFGDAYFGIVSALLTLMILVFSEIIPKTLGASYSRELSGFVARALQVMMFIAYPFVLGAMYLTQHLSRSKKAQSTSREELSAMVNMGVEQGVVSDKENKIIQNLIRLKTLRVTDMMTPRVVVILADEEMTLEDFLKDKDMMKFSRIPVYHEQRDNITGYVFREEVFEKLAEDHHHLRLRDLKRDMVTLPEITTLYSAWEILLQKKEHIALIVDEYGGMEGVLTMEDIVETLLGIEIMDEKDSVADMQQYALERWKSKQQKYRWLQPSSGTFPVSSGSKNRT